VLIPPSAAIGPHLSEAGQVSAAVSGQSGHTIGQVAGGPQFIRNRRLWIKVVAPVVERCDGNSSSHRSTTSNDVQRARAPLSFACGPPKLDPFHIERLGAGNQRADVVVFCDARQCLAPIGEAITS